MALPQPFAPAADSTALRISLRLPCPTCAISFPSVEKTGLEYPLSGRVCLPPMKSLAVRSISVPAGSVFPLSAWTWASSMVGAFFERV